MKKSNKDAAIQGRRMQLEKELAKIKAIEEQDVINEFYPKIKKQYEGKYFKYRNRYNDKESWWMYTKVEEIKPDDVYDTRGNGVTAHYSGYQFQTDSKGQITIEHENRGYVHMVGHPISKAEFNNAWNKMIEKINQFK